MTPKSFTEALTRLSHQPLGLQEATILFLIAIGFDTNRALSGAADSPMSHIYSRTNILKRKNLINQVYNAQGKLYHVLTIKGKKVARIVMGVDV